MIRVGGRENSLEVFSCERELRNGMVTGGNVGLKKGEQDASVRSGLPRKRGRNCCCCQGW